MREKTYRIYTPLLMLALMNVIGFGLLAFENAAEADRIKTGVTALLFMLLLIVSYLLIRALHMGDGYLFLPVTALMSIEDRPFIRRAPDALVRRFGRSVLCFLFYVPRGKNKK